MLTVTVEKLDEAVVLHCTGRIVRGEETALLCAASKQHGRTIMLDLEKVEAIDAAGVGALVALQAAGIYVQLINPNERVRQILRVTQLDSVLEIAPPPTSSMPAQAVA